MIAIENELPLPRNRGFRLLMGGQLASSLGTAVAGIALPLVLLELTGSTSAAGGISAATLAVTLILGLFGGVLADRWPRRRLLIISALTASAAWALGASFLGAGTFALPGIIIAALISATAMTLFQPAQDGAVRHVVPSSQLSQAIAIDEARETVASLIGAPIGGVLLALGAVATLWANAAGFFIAALSIAAVGMSLGPDHIAVRQSGARATVRSLLYDAGAGLRHLWLQPSVRICFIAAGVLNIPFVGIQVGLVIALREAGVPVYLIGFAELASGLGALVGALLVGTLTRRFKLGHQIAVTTAAIAVSGLLIGLAFPHIFLVLPACFLNTLFVPALNGSLIGHVFATAPEEMAGRIGAAARISSGVLIPLAPLIAGILIDVVGGRAALFTFGAILVALAVALTSARSVRSLTAIDAAP